MTKDEDYEVREYLEKLNNLRNNTPSRSGTLNTVISSDHINNTSRPITPTGTGISSNGKIPHQENISEPDHFSHFPTKRSLHSPKPQQFNSSTEKPVIMELEEPSRVIRGHPQVPVSYVDRNTREDPVESYTNNSNKGFNDPHLGLPELPPYTESPTHFQRDVSSISSPAMAHPQPVYAQPHASTQPKPPAAPVTNDYEPPPRIFYEPEQPPMTVPSKFGSDSSEPPQRPVTPAGSAVRVEISMKPSRSVGTISNASGLILNTDL